MCTYVLRIWQNMILQNIAIWGFQKLKICWIGTYLSTYLYYTKFAIQLLSRYIHYTSLFDSRIFYIKQIKYKQHSNPPRSKHKKNKGHTFLIINKDWPCTRVSFMPLLYTIRTTHSCCLTLVVFTQVMFICGFKL